MEFRIQGGVSVSGALKSASSSGSSAEGHEYAWEKSYERSWEAVEEDESGLIRTEALERARRAAQQRKQAAEAGGVVQGMRVQRGMLRHVFLVLDMSRSMLATDIKPSRAVAVARVAQEFAAEFFDQNPISSLGLIVAKRGVAEKVGDLSANRDRCIRLIAAHCGLLGVAAGANDAALAAASAGVCEGEFSLQTCLEIGYRSLQLVPPYGSREILVIHGSHSSVDAGNILTTIQNCKNARITVNFISLPGEVFIATKCAAETGGRWAVPEGYDSLRTQALSHCVPPPKKRRAPRPNKDSDDDDDDDIERARSVPMGFPRMLGEAGGLDNTSGGAGAAASTSGSDYSMVPCACHGEIKSNIAQQQGAASAVGSAPTGGSGGGGYICPRCDAKLCDLPCSCSVCGLQLISAARLARSYHHLFPVPLFVEVTGVDEPAVLGREVIEEVTAGATSAEDAVGSGMMTTIEGMAGLHIAGISSSTGKPILTAEEFKKRQDKIASVIARYLPLGAAAASSSSSNSSANGGGGGQEEELLGRRYDDVEVLLTTDSGAIEGDSDGDGEQGNKHKRQKTGEGKDSAKANSKKKAKLPKTRPARLLRLPLLVSDDSPCCCACGITFRPRTSRFVCLGCKSAYCHDCDTLIHETLHNCPGCC
jgi:transcription initiation factor TFIIH subunit 2